MKKFTRFGLILTLILTVALTGCGSGGNGNPPTDQPQYVYVTNQDNNSISAFSINPDNGGLTNISGSPFSTGSDTSPSSLAADPSGKFLYVTNFPNNVSVYSINAATGALNQITGSPFTTNNNPEKVTVDPTGNFVAVGCRYYLNIFSRDKTSGALANQASYTFGSNEEVRAVSFDRTGQFLYVAVSTGAIYVYAKNTDSNTFAQASGSPFPTCSGPSSIAIGPNGAYLYVTTASSTAISIHPINGDGSLADDTTRNISAQSSALLIQGNFLYMAKFTGIAAYSIMADGSLSEIGVDIPLADGINPNSLAIDATGKFLYTTGWYSNNIWGFAMMADGSLSKITDNSIDSGSEITSIVTIKPIP